MSQTCMAPRGATGRPLVRNWNVPLWWVAALIFALALTSFSAPQRGVSLDGSSLDLVAKLKVLVRLAAIGVLGTLLLTRLGTRAMQRLLWWALPLLAFVAWAVVSVSWSALPRISLGQASGLAVLVMLMLVMADLARDPRARDVLVKVLLVTLGCYSLAVLGMLLMAADVVGLDRYEEGAFHPTAVGATASLGLVMSLARVLTGGDRFDRNWALALAPVHLVCLLVANNRLSMGLLVMLGGMLLAWKAPRRVLAGWLLAASLLGLTLLLADPGLEVVLGTLGMTEQYVRRGQGAQELTALSGRAEMWAAMIESFAESPWRGHGYFVSSRTGAMEVWNSVGNKTAHNGLLQVLVTTGVIGATLVGAWLLSLVVSCGRACVRGDSPVAVLLGVALLWYFGWSLLNASIFGPVQPESVFFYGLAGCFLGSRLQQREVEPERDRPAQHRDAALQRQLARCPQETFA